MWLVGDGHMDKIVKEIIKREADRIKRKIMGDNDKYVSMLYGEPLDMDDMDSMIVATWCVCSQEMSNAHQRDMDFVFGTKKDNG